MPTKHAPKVRPLVAPQFASFDWSARAEASADAEAGPRLTSLPILPPMPPGGAVGRDGRGPFTADIAEIRAHVQSNGADIPVFVDHVTGKAFGWHPHQAEPVQMADGSWEWPVEFTEEGLALVLSKAYRYNSPTWLYIQDESIPDRQAGRVVGLQENSLVNLPNQYLRALNSQDPSGSYTGHQSTGIRPMNAEQLAALGLDETATAEQITAALNSLCAAAARATAITEAAGAAADAEPAAVVEAAAQSRVASGAFVSRQALDEAVSARDAALSAQKAAEDALAAVKSEQAQAAAEAAAQAAEAAVDAAISSGKFVPAAREALAKQARADLATFQAVVAAMPVHPAASGAAVATQSVQGDAAHGLTAEQLAKCQQLGIEPAHYAKALRAAKA